MTWLDELLAQHIELESPKSFWMWAGLVSISAVVKDNIWLNRAGAYKLYPNIYVILFADSGLKKGPPINLAKDLVKRVNNTNIISGRSSIQGILKEMGTAHTVPGGKINSKSTAFIVSSELSSSLVSDPAAMTILTDLFDRNYNEGEWRSLLKMETFQLRDPTVTMFGGINEAHAESFFERKDIQGGYYARTFIVHETEHSTINSLARRLTHPPNREILIPYLKELSSLKGPFVELSDEENKLTSVGEYFDNWYKEFKGNIKTNKIRDPTGTLNRFDDSVLKVAILLSLSKSPKLEIDLDSLKQAISLCEGLVGNIRKTTMGKEGRSNYAMHKTLIIDELMRRDNHMITRAQLNKKYWMHGSATEWDEIMLSFEVAGMFVIESIGNQVVYRMPDSVVRKMSNYLGGKNEGDD